MEDSRCIICLCSVNESRNLDDIYKSTRKSCSCKYFIHNECFTNWINHNDICCPLCRKVYQQFINTSSQINSTDIQIHIQSAEIISYNPSCCCLISSICAILIAVVVILILIILIYRDIKL